MSSHPSLQLEPNTAGCVLAFRLSSLSLLSLTVPNLAPVVYNLYTYLFNLTLHVVSELLIHIPMKEIFNENRVFVEFFLSLALQIPVETPFPKVT